MKSWFWFILIVFICIVTLLYSEATHYERYNNSAIDKAEAGIWREALYDYHQALVIAPDNPVGYFNLALLRISRNDWKIAEQALHQALLQDNPTLQPEIYYNLGNLYYDIGDYSMAIEAYQQALRLNPNMEDARYNLELAMRSAEQPTPTPQLPPNQSNMGGELPNETDRDGNIIEIQPTQAIIGAMSLEEAENLLNQIQRDQQALTGNARPTDTSFTIPEKDW